MLRKLVLIVITLALLTGCAANTALPTPDTTLTPTALEAATAIPPEPTPTPFIQVFPTANPELLLFTVHIQAVRVADDDGANLANISPDEIIQYLNTTNEIFAASGIRFLFDPQTDVSIVQSTSIANMLGHGDLRWQDEMEAADKVALDYPGKLVIFFRQNPVEEPTGKGNFFWWDYNFVLMPITQEVVCGNPDSTRLAHELGHYLGLGNTFKEVLPDLAAAEEAYAREGYTLQAFDGDLFTDTPPDLYINQDEYRCGSAAEITVSNAQIPVTRGNLMSYYHPRVTLTPMQTARARYMLALRHRDGMIMPSNRDLKYGFELENITILEQRWVNTEVKDMTPLSSRNWSSGKHLSVFGGYGSALMVEFEVEKDGIYMLTLYATNAPDYAVLEVEVNELLVNDYVDLYAPFTFASGPIGLGAYYLAKGKNQILFKAAKKNELSQGYNFGLDAITVEPQ